MSSLRAGFGADCALAPLANVNNNTISAEPAWNHLIMSFSETVNITTIFWMLRAAPDPTRKYSEPRQVVLFLRSEVHSANLSFPLAVTHLTSIA